ncbi:MAG: hypothetical protein IH857_03585 [Deltaproteobacteria bacterium]|nr:hypothetical protein [Deltaproteobacteria bacterium]
MLLLGIRGLLFGQMHADDPRFPMTAPQEKKLIVEQVYQFYVMRYDPPVEMNVLENLPSEKADNASMIAIAFLSAQARGNYKWYVNLLSNSYKSKIEKELARTGKTPEDLVREWQKRFANRRVELTHYVKRGRCPSCAGSSRFQHSIIRYQVIDPEQKKIVEKGDLAFMFDLGRGWVAMDLSGDLVYENWDFPDAVKRMTKQKGR